ncbi:uncharacterized protein [Panulirus ornatus]|uniref:uncharacterized protein isoform X7 n=1 Tax=Panulirus ornatus TaxID=150431 RepID=UPI003A84DEE1
MSGVGCGCNRETSQINPLRKEMTSKNAIHGEVAKSYLPKGPHQNPLFGIGVPYLWRGNFLMMTGDDDDNIVECEVDDASCVICNEVLDEELHQPVALPACGHTFCKPCLVKLQHRSHDLLCPTCRKPHEGEDVANLPLNYLVLSLLPYSSEKEDRSPQSEDFENKDSRAKANCDDGHNKDEKHHSQPQVEEDLKPTKKELKENESQLKNPDTDLGNARNMLKMGFTSKGIAKGSYASGLMSSSSRSNNGTIPRESWVAWLQNIGHKGFTPRSQAVLGIIGALTVVMLFGVPIACCLVICWRKKKRSAYSSSSDGIPLTGSRTPEERQFC